MSASILDATNGSDDQDGRINTADLTESFIVGEWCIDVPRRCARNADTEVKIDPRNLRVLQALAARAGRIVSPREIESYAWEGVVVTPNSLHQSIRQLRNALGDSKSPATYIETVPRRGYRLVAKVGKPTRAVELDTVSLQAPVETPPQATGVGALDAKNRWRVGLVASVIVMALIGLYALGLFDAFTHGRSNIGRTLVGMPTMEKMDVQTLRSLAQIMRDRGNPGEALPYLNRALQLQLSSTGEYNQLVVDILFELANTHFWLGDDVQALQTARRAHTLLEKVTPDSSPERISTLSGLAEVLTGIGAYAEADGVITASVELALKHYGAGHIATLRPISLKATLRYAQGRLPEAEQLAREALSSTINARGADDHRVAYEGTQLSMILLDMGRYAEAEREARASIDVLMRAQLEDHPYSLSAKHALAEALVNLNRLDQAEPILRSEITFLVRHSGENWRIARAAGTLAEGLLRHDEVSGAKKYLAIAESRLAAAKGWPAQRELRNLRSRKERLETALAGRTADHWLRRQPFMIFRD